MYAYLYVDVYVYVDVQVYVDAKAYVDMIGYVYVLAHIGRKNFQYHWRHTLGGWYFFYLND